MSYILAVDDTPDNLLLIKLALESEGHEIVLANDALTALAYIEQSPPKLILLDVMMPKMDGYEVTRRIRQNQSLPFIPILLITAHEETSAVKGLDLGADEFIRKPINLDELQARVRSLLRLKETIDQRENFVSCLTHDLRTPLVAIERVLMLMGKGSFGAVTPKMQEVIASIVSSNQNLLCMLNNLLDIHSYEVGQRSLSLIDFDLQELIGEIVRELTPLAESKKLNLQFNWHANTTTIKGDRLELRRLLTNLISNGIKFTEQGGVEIETIFHGEEIAIAVRDTGIGITPEDQALIFDRFRQGNHKRSGHGLGLYLCQQIVQAHQGRLQVQSELGRGTCFTVGLPNK